MIGTIVYCAEHLSNSHISPLYCTLSYYLLLPEAIQLLCLMVFLFICEISNGDVSSLGTIFKGLWDMMKCFFLTSVPSAIIAVLVKCLSICPKMSKIMTRKCTKIAL